MKVAIYTIALNEKQFVERWHESAKEADYLLIADTGSSDGTVELAESLGISIVRTTVRPWRFDMARNAALAALPEDIDYCIALDMDEILLPGWRPELEKALQEGSTRPRYQYTWSWVDADETIPGLQYGGDKIHSRFGYRWKHPVHEVIVPYGGAIEKQSWVGLEIHHHPDSSKSRSQYLPLLKIAVDEDPSDDRNAFYYARELFFNRYLVDAAQEFKRHLELPNAKWPPERAASMRYLAQCEPQLAIEWLKKAVEEAPNRREALVELARHYYYRSMWAECLEASSKAVGIQEKPLEYLCEDFAWGSLPHDLLAISAFHLGKFELALQHGEIASKIEPNNQRLANNLIEYRSALT